MVQNVAVDAPARASAAVSAAPAAAVLLSQEQMEAQHAVSQDDASCSSCSEEYGSNDEAETEDSAAGSEQHNRAVQSLQTAPSWVPDHTFKACTVS